MADVKAADGKSAVLAQIYALGDAVSAEFTDVRDTDRVGQALAGLAVAHMALGLLYDARENRAALPAHHAAEAAHGGHYAQQRAQTPAGSQIHYEEYPA